MVNFTSGLIKYKNRYIPTQWITNIEPAENNQNTCVTIINQTDGISQKTHCIKYTFEGSPEQWAESYSLAEKNGGILNVLA